MTFWRELRPPRWFKLHFMTSQLDASDVTNDVTNVAVFPLKVPVADVIIPVSLLGLQVLSFIQFGTKKETRFFFTSSFRVAVAWLHGLAEVTACVHVCLPLTAPNPFQCMAFHTA